MGIYIKTCIIHLRQCENMYALCIITRTHEHVCKCVCVTVCICRLYRITLIFVVKNLADWYSKYFQLQNIGRLSMYAYLWNKLVQVDSFPYQFLWHTQHFMSFNGIKHNNKSVLTCKKFYMHMYAHTGIQLVICPCESQSGTDGKLQTFRTAWNSDK